MLDQIISYLFPLFEIACGIAIIMRFRRSPGALLGGIAFGIWVAGNITRTLLGAFEVDWWNYNLAFTLANLAAYGFLLAALITGRTHGQTQTVAGEQDTTGTERRGPISIPEVLFSFKGRISRSEYWLKGFLILFPLGAFNDILMFGTDSDEAHALAIFLGIVSMWPGLALVFKRWHDRNRSAWWLLTLLIPFANLVFAIWIIVEVWFLKGTDGPNRFGQDPLQRGGEVPNVNK